MSTMETIQYIGERAQIAMIVGSVPIDGGGDISILYANGPAVALFGYPSQRSMETFGRSCHRQYLKIIRAMCLPTLIERMGARLERAVSWVVGGP
jgi:hypothetical protein